MFRIFTVLFLLLSLISCGRKGEFSPNDQPEIMITSYEGVSDQSEIDDPLTFQQKIFWNAFDQDGVVEDFAFRVLNDAENPIPTSGYEFIDEEGWIFHHQKGADETLALDDPNANITIWSDQVFAVINFPANIDGNAAEIISIFEVKCIDNRGEESEICRK